MHGNYTLNENLEKIEYFKSYKFKSYKGGDNEDVPLYPKAIEDLLFIINRCNEDNIPQPFIAPWAGGDCVQAEWDYNWYLEIDMSSKGIDVLIIKNNLYDKPISCKFLDIEDALILIKHFIQNVVDLNGERKKTNDSRKCD